MKTVCFRDRTEDSHICTLCLENVSYQHGVGFPRDSTVGEDTTVKMECTSYTENPQRGLRYRPRSRHLARESVFFRKDVRIPGDGKCVRLKTEKGVHALL